MQDYKTWYAIQKTSEDGWDLGSEDYDEAVEMLDSRKGYHIIAEIRIPLDENGNELINLAECVDEEWM